MRSYLNLYSPNLLDAIGRLETLASQFEEVTGGTKLRQEEKKISFMDRIRKADVSVGEADFIFEWHEDPEVERILQLIRAVDEQLGELKTRYTITTDVVGTDAMSTGIQGDLSVTFVKFMGPPIALAIERMAEREPGITKITERGISKGKYDFYFTWKHPPSKDEIYQLITYLEESLGDTGVMFTTTTVDTLQSKTKLDRTAVFMEKNKSLETIIKGSRV